MPTGPSHPISPNNPTVNGVNGNPTIQPSNPNSMPADPNAVPTDPNAMPTNPGTNAAP